MLIDIDPLILDQLLQHAQGMATMTANCLSNTELRLRQAAYHLHAQETLEARRAQYQLKTNAWESLTYQLTEAKAKTQ